MENHLHHLYNMFVYILQHGPHPKVSIDVDFHLTPDLFLGVSKYWLARHDSSVVYKDSHISYFLADRLSQFEDCCAIGNVTPESNSILMFNFMFLEHHRFKVLHSFLFLEPYFTYLLILLNKIVRLSLKNSK